MDDELSERMEGYLEKKSTIKFCNWWKRYWFVLNGKLLRCYKNEEESEATKDSDSKVFLNFVNVQVVRPVYDSSHPQRFVVEIITKNSTIKLAASDEQCRKKWLHMFHRALSSGPSISAPITRGDEEEVCGASTTTDRPSLTICCAETETDKCEESSSSKEQQRLDRLTVTCFSPRASTFFTSEQYQNWPQLSLNLYDEVVQQVNQNFQLHGLALENNDINDQITQTDFSSSEDLSRLD